MSSTGSRRPAQAGAARRAVRGQKSSAALPERLGVTTAAACPADLENVRRMLSEAVRLQAGNAPA
ncbi:hypothetical protein ACSLFT_20895 [Streptomyces sp. G6]|uniref:hypothetical protein n=1 Tax=Streptomyces sp. G6 TaxID=1178736 RepID=UPI003ED8DDAF